MLARRLGWVGSSPSLKLHHFPSQNPPTPGANIWAHLIHLYQGPIWFPPSDLQPWLNPGNAAGTWLLGSGERWQTGQTLGWLAHRISLCSFWAQLKVGPCFFFFF